MAQGRDRRQAGTHRNIARAVQVVRQLRQPEQRGAIEIVPAAGWLSQLSA